MSTALLSKANLMSIRNMKKDRLTDAVCDYLDEKELMEFLTDLKSILQKEEDRLTVQIDIFKTAKTLIFDSLVFTEKPIDETKDSTFN